MRILGIEFSGAELRYVLIETDVGNPQIHTANRLTLADTRSGAALSAFQSAILATLNESAPDLIAIKSKPETGQMRAGAAALKMEGILLANAKCDVEFVSSARIGKIPDTRNDLYGYLQLALKAALAASNK